MEEIKGIVDSLIYYNNDNGYIIAKINEGNKEHTIVGIIPYIKEGQELRVRGEWVLHPKFGRQLSVKECEEVLPNTVDGIKKYLSSGVIFGIGPITAQKLIEKFGEKTLEVLDEDIDKIKEIEGIGEKKFQVIKESYISQRELKNVIIFLQTYGVSTNQCIKIYKKFGGCSVDKVKENPYVLCDEISGIGFKTADRIARNLGVGADSQFRVQSGIKYVIREFCANGNTYMPKEILIKEAVKALTVNKEIIEECIYNANLEGQIKVEEVDNIEAVFNIPYYYCELGITKKILSLAIANFQDINIDLEYEITLFENKHEITFAESQRKAIIGAFCNGIEIITGGPGTGKTTIIRCIIEIFEKCNMKVLLGAPTGRAAKRMGESTEHEAKTIHRMLEMGIANEEDSMFNKDESSPLECDVIIIDEASMIDIMLMNNLLKAIKVGTRAIFVGDVDQLPSVGPGNVLKDLINSEFTEVVRLKEIFRQGKESMIVVNAHKINEGQMPVLNEKNKDFFFLKESSLESNLNTILELANRRLPNYNKEWDKLKSIQVLTPMKKGPLGVTNLNEKLQDILNPKAQYKKEKIIREMVFREGDKVMQTKNNYSLKWIRVAGEGEHEGVGVFNGDMGFISDIDEEEKTITVIFDEERKVRYDYIYLEELDLAYAITIHKSQGSEFPVVITPAFMGSPFLMNRNLLYTGITRAKKLVVVVGEVRALKYMIDNNKSMERYSSLGYRIKSIVNNDVFK